MAKAKRANHRTGSDRGEGPGWESATVTGSTLPGANGHAGQNGHGANGQAAQNTGQNTAQGPQGARPPQYGPQNGQQPQNGQKPQNGRPPQNGQQAARGAQTVPGSQSTQSWRTIQGPPNGQPPTPGQSSAPGPARTADLGTPVKVDEIAIAAKTLSENLQAAARGLPESVASRQFRRDLDDAADTFREAANELETTAGNLLRLAASEGQTCGVTWGACPDHGLTLMNAGEVVTCHVLGCHREYEGVIERCTQPVAYRVVDVAGPALMTCAGHAIACRLHLDGAVITLASDSLELL
jgi:hypothetical protein